MRGREGEGRRAERSPPTIRPGVDRDWPAAWSILEPIFREGETYAVDQAIEEAEARAYWTRAAWFVVERAGAIVATYYLRPNAPGRGAHVCNCGYAVVPEARGEGLARAMLAHSLEAARAAGYRAMQYNFVLANNVRALATWRRAGFAEIGRIPEAYDHPRDGLVDAVILRRSV